MRYVLDGCKDHRERACSAVLRLTPLTCLSEPAANSSGLATRTCHYTAIQETSTCGTLCAECAGRRHTNSRVCGFASAAWSRRNDHHTLGEVRSRSHNIGQCQCVCMQVRSTTIRGEELVTRAGRQGTHQSRSAPIKIGHSSLQSSQMCTVHTSFRHCFTVSA